MASLKNLREAHYMKEDLGGVEVVLVCLGFFLFCLV